MKDFAEDPLTLGLVGAGIMGRGIAQIAAQAGIRVILYDSNGTVLDEAVKFVHKMLDRAVEKGRMDAAAAQACKANLETVTGLEDMRPADVIIEAVIENLEIKQAIFKDLEGFVPVDCILATNTSSLSVTAVAAACRHPGRVAGCHFFNPVPLMKLVEIIGGVRTDHRCIEQLLALTNRLGHTPVSVQDAPGFLVNHLGRGLNTEGLRIRFEGIADVHEIDAVMRDCVGLRMGPFELMDLTGLDVTCPVNEQIHDQYYQEPRLRPTPLLRQRYVAGVLGRKTGQGFYNYKDGNRIDPARRDPPPVPDQPVFWVCDAIPEFAGRIRDLLSAAGVEPETGEKPGPAAIALVTPLGEDTTTACMEQGLDPGRTVGVDAMFDLDKRICLMTSPATAAAAVNAAWSILAATGRAVTVIHDSPGLIAQRVVANIINTACDIAQQGIARPEDIDTGARLGLGYPTGPLALGDKIGAARVLEILTRLQALYGDPRYRPSIWLRRRALLGLSLLQVEVH